MSRTRRPSLWGCALLIVLGLLAAPAAGQAPAGEPEPGEELTVYLMTMGPGRAVWERFGHNAIRIRDDLRGTDIAYNYGMFSFEQENFLLRFIRGRMDYWMEGFDAQGTALMYAQADRSVWVQELNLSPAQRAALRDFLEWNARPENRFYRYDYFADNCSTRVRDAIDLVLGGQLRARTDGEAAGTTYREHTRSLTAADPLLYSGLMLGLGQPVDRAISAWEEMFLPMVLRERIRDVTIVNDAGERVPLVVAEETLHRSGVPEELPPPGSRLPAHLVLGLAIGGALVWSGGRRANGRGRGRAFAWLGGGWSLLAGVLGLVLVGLWAFTDHATSYRNENILFFNPVLTGLAVLIPIGLRRSAAALRAAATLAAVVAILSVAGFAAQALPWLSQVNGEMIALAMPINVALAISLARVVRNRSDDGGDDPAAARASVRTATAAAA